MSGRKKLLLFLSIICFAAVAGCIALDYKWFALGGFFAYALIMLLATKSEDDEDEEEEEEYELVDSYAELEESKAKIAELEEKISKFRQYVALEKSRTEKADKRYRRAIKKLQAELREEKKKLELKESLNMQDFLPDCDEAQERETVNILDITKNVIKEMEQYMDPDLLNIHLTSQEEEIMVNANRERLRVLFRNIIDNSIKYMKKKGSIFIVFGRLDTDILIVIKDNGEGLSKEETAHIFEMNFQGSNRVSGNGLGLTQTKAIVEYYGGTVYAKSSKGSGMAIYIQLPSSEALVVEEKVEEKPVEKVVEKVEEKPESEKPPVKKRRIRRKKKVVKETAE